MTVDSPPHPRRTRRSGSRPGRQAKQLDGEPSVFVANLGGGGLTLTSPSKQEDRAVAGAGSGAPTATEEEGQLLDAATARTTTADAETLRQARRIAARLSIPKPRRVNPVRYGGGELASVRYRGGSDDIDLDATLESVVEHPVPADEDIVVRERVRVRRSVVLAVDVSASMRGERIRTAAATVGALAGELANDDLAVVAFWADAVLAPFGRPLSPPAILDLLARIRAKGLTNIAFPLHLAHQQLTAMPAREARVLLLSDCVHNAGPDPRTVAARLPRLDVLVDTTAEHDVDLARDLARLGRGRLAVIRQFRDVAPALNEIFST